MALLPSDPQGQKKLLLLLLPLVAAFMYWYLYYGDATAEVASMEQRLEQLEATNRTARVKAKQGGPALERKLALYEEHMRRLEQLIPSGEEVPELLNAMALEARRADVELALMRPASTTQGEFYTRQVFDITVIGTYHDVGRFLTAVGSLPRIVKPINLRLIARNELNDAGEMRLEASFGIQTYVLPSGGVQTEARTDAQQT